MRTPSPRPSQGSNEKKQTYLVTKAGELASCGLERRSKTHYRQLNCFRRLSTNRVEILAFVANGLQSVSRRSSPDLLDSETKTSETLLGLDGDVLVRLVCFI